MVPDTPKDDHLFPERHPQKELFVCDVADAILKDDMASMEHPFFSLSKKPDTQVRRYENGNCWLEIVPSVKGLATIYDKDILIYCISQLIAKMRAGEEPSPLLKITASDLLTFTNRSTGGRDYESLKEALDRLEGTRIRTNIETGGEEEYKGFGLINAFEIRRSKKTGRILEMKVELSQWVFRSIEAREVLTLHPDYFRLRKAIDRRVYEIARKHCGKQEQWKIALAKLKNKCGSRSPMKGFRFALKSLAQGDYLPDYRLAVDDRDNVWFYNRRAVETIQETHPTLDPETYHDARTVAPGYDVYELEREWRMFWVESGRPELKNPDAAFIGFCRRRYTPYI